MSITSNWFSPTLISQDYTDSPPYTAWKGDNGGLTFPLSLTKDLSHYANSGGPGPAMTDIRNKTTLLTFTGFNLPLCQGIITGVELRLDIQRNGRIADSDVFLSYQGGNLGATQVDYSQDLEGHLIKFNLNQYGGDGNNWGAELTPEIIADPSFGINLRLQSHPFVPHKCGCRIYGMALRYYYA
jgi:hypothetical protein